MQRFFVLAALIGCLTTVSGCGNKGPLYLPEAPAEPRTQDSETENAPEQP